jgi:hypothetical protein
MALLIAALVLWTATPPAHALEPTTVLAAAKTAYDAYQKFAGGQMTLEQATTLIIIAIEQAKVEILAHIDLVAVADVRHCAQNTVINGLDLAHLSPDNVQAFADSATDCVTKAQALIETPGTLLAAVDVAGFAVNVVGPIALFAREYAHLTEGIPLLRETLRRANTSVRTQLHPSCASFPLRGDEEPGSILEYMLVCTAYNGNKGHGSGWGNRPFNWNEPITQAMQGTSYLVAVTVLPQL